MEYIDRFKNLKVELEKENYGPENNLDSIKERLKLYIRKSMGESSYYLEKIRKILFFPPIMTKSTTKDDYQNSWNSGKKQLLVIVDTLIEDIQLSNPQERSTNKAEIIASRDIFIVHGRDDGMKETVARTVENLKLNPIILHEQSNEGKTIIEKFEKYSDVGFAIILLSSDDVGSLKNETDNLKPRARQNVIFEMGYFIGKLGRERVFTLLENSLFLSI